MGFTSDVSKRREVGRRGSRIDVITRTESTISGPITKDHKGTSRDNGTAIDRPRGWVWRLELQIGVWRGGRRHIRTENVRPLKLGGREHGEIPTHNTAKIPPGRAQYSIHMRPIGADAAHLPFFIPPVYTNVPDRRSLSASSTMYSAEPSYAYGPFLGQQMPHRYRASVTPAAAHPQPGRSRSLTPNYQGGEKVFLQMGPSRPRIFARLCRNPHVRLRIPEKLDGLNDARRPRAEWGIIPSPVGYGAEWIIPKLTTATILQILKSGT